jgi:hypothetical protein
VRAVQERRYSRRRAGGLEGVAGCGRGFAVGERATGFMTGVDGGGC